MIPLSASLAAHQAGTARLPAIWVTASATRGGADLLRWTRCYTGSEADCPHAAVLTPAGTLLRVRNDAGAVRQSRVPAVSPASTFSTWTQITSLVAGGSLAIAAHGSDLCVFFTVAGSTSVYRLRRTAGAWGTAAEWSCAGSVAALSGVAATHDGSDFQLLVSGTEATTSHKRVWAVAMGDRGFTTDSWSALSNVAESDSGSTAAFGWPAIGVPLEPPRVLRPP